MKPIPSILARTIPAVVVMLLAFAAAPAAARRMDVEVWTDRGDDAVYEPGDAMRVKVRSTEDAYLLVYEIDSNGDVNLLYPWKRGRGMVEARSTLRLPAENSDVQLVVEKETGQGFIVAIASAQPFRELPWYLRPYDPQAASVGYEDTPEDTDHKDTEGVDEQGRVVGDPYVAMERIRRSVLTQPGDSPDFASAYSTYYVHEQVRYPRYLCADCHRPNQWTWWQGFDPYYARCSVMDFRVNWSWCWGPPLYTAYVPYYYYVVRSDCPPRYQTWYDNRSRFSSWDGRRRWTDLWGGELRRYKDRPAPAPVGYTPPPGPGTVWKKTWTPPGIVPPDVRRQTGSPGGQTGWLNRDRGDGKPVFRDDPRGRPSVGGGGVPDVGRGRGDNGRGNDAPRWRPADGTVPRGGANPSPPEGRGGSRGEQGGQGSQGGQGGERTRGDSQPRQDPPRHEQPRSEPPRHDPGYKQSPPPPSQDHPRWSPPSNKPEPTKGKGGKEGKGGRG